MTTYDRVEKNFTNRRISRKQFWRWEAGLIAINFSALILLGDSARVVWFITNLIGGWLGAQRLHDVGESGWWIIAPFYNIYLLCKRGEEGVNKWGAPIVPE